MSAGQIQTMNPQQVSQARRPSGVLATLILVALALFSSQVSALSSGPLAALLDEARGQLPVGTRVAAIVRAPSGRLLLSRNADDLMPPASTLKLLTMLAAWEILGPDFRFHTELLQSESGDLVVRFSGDPFFQRSDLVSLLDAALAQGPLSIKGDVLLDASLFAGHDRSIAQSWSDMTTCFAAPSSAISLNHNCVLGNLQTGGIGEPARVYLPDYEPLEIVNETRVLLQDQVADRHCELELSHLGENRYRISGCTPQRRRALPLSIAVNDPARYVAEILRDLFASRGLRIPGQVRAGQSLAPFRELAVHRSAPLADMISDLASDSDNQLADVLFRHMGYQLLNRDREPGQAPLPASFRAGAEAVREQLGKQQIELGNAKIVDGSGLSRHNLISARILDQVLSDIAAHEDQRMYQALPVSGLSGSLRYRRGLVNEPLKGRIRAKSGSLTGSSHLAGFVETLSGETLQFVLLVDGFSLSPETWQDVSGRPALHPLKQFHEQFFGSLIRGVGAQSQGE